jgi:hypothetical protein
MVLARGSFHCLRAIANINTKRGLYVQEKRVREFVSWVCFVNRVQRILSHVNIYFKKQNALNEIGMYMHRSLLTEWEMKVELN